jgi:hypothetical protein
MIAFGRMHRHRHISMYARNWKDAQAYLVHRTDTPNIGLIKRIGRIIAKPITGRLHYRCAEIQL